MSNGVSLPLDGAFTFTNNILETVKSNFINLILTVPGERLNNPAFGCNIHRLVFDFSSTNLSSQARETVEQAVQKWMPYLQIEEFALQQNNTDIDTHRANLYVRYRLSENPNLTDEVLVTV